MAKDEHEQQSFAKGGAEAAGSGGRPRAPAHVERHACVHALRPDHRTQFHGVWFGFKVEGMLFMTFSSESCSSSRSGGGLGGGDGGGGSGVVVVVSGGCCQHRSCGSVLRKP